MCHFITSGRRRTLYVSLITNAAGLFTCMRLFIGLSIYCIIFSLSPYCTLWKEVCMHSPHLCSEYLCFISLMVNYLHKLIGILHRDVCVFACICGITKLFIYISIESWIFTFTQCYNVHTFMSQIVPTLFCYFFLTFFFTS